MKITLTTPEIRLEKSQVSTPVASDSVKDSVDLVYNLLKKGALSEQEIDTLSVNIEHLRLKTDSVNADRKKIVDSAVDNTIDTSVATVTAVK